MKENVILNAIKRITDLHLKSMKYPYLSHTYLYLSFSSPLPRES